MRDGPPIAETNAFDDVCPFSTTIASHAGLSIHARARRSNIENITVENENKVLATVRQGCKSIVTSLSAVAIVVLSPLNIADTATNTIASVLSPIPIAIVFALLKTQLSSCFVICHFVNTTQPPFL